MRIDLHISARPWYRRVPVILIAAALLLLSSCAGEDSGAALDMDDFTYGGRRGEGLGITATGDRRDLGDFSGRFVWVDYSAPWCGPCVRQAPVIRSLEHAFGDKVVFVTVLTSDTNPRSPATRNTARVWARRFNLDPEHVVGGSEGQRFIPTHIVFSPLGQTLYVETGLRSEGHIRSTLQKLIRDYDQWYEANKSSTSVILSEIGD